MLGQGLDAPTHEADVDLREGRIASCIQRIGVKKDETSARPLKPDTTVTVAGPQPVCASRLRQPAGLSRLDPALSDGRGVIWITAGRYQYGRRGTPTSEALEQALQRIEGPACAGVKVAPSGLAAISIALLSVLNAGDHLLVTDSAYGPTRSFCDTVLARLGVSTTYYDPLCRRPHCLSVAAEHPRRVYRVAGLALLRDAGHPGDRRGGACAERGLC